MIHGGRRWIVRKRPTSPACSGAEVSAARIWSRRSAPVRSCRAADIGANDHHRYSGRRGEVRFGERTQMRRIGRCRRPAPHPTVLVVHEAWAVHEHSRISAGDSPRPAISAMRPTCLLATVTFPRWRPRRSCRTCSQDRRGAGRQRPRCLRRVRTGSGKSDIEKPFLRIEITAVSARVGVLATRARSASNGSDRGNALDQNSGARRS